MNNNNWKISQCCQFHQSDLVKLYNIGTVTRTYALAPGGKQKVQAKALANIDKLYSTLVNYFVKQPHNLRSFRIGSYLLPCYTVPEVADWYAEIDEQLRIKLQNVGKLATLHNIRLSTHPGQYTVLGSNSTDVVKNSIEDIEYHALFGKYMGLDPDKFVVNIHLSGVYGKPREHGIKRFADNFKYLSDYAQQCLAVENEDKPNGYDIEHVLDLCMKIPTRATLDVHHYDCWGKQLRPFPTRNSDFFKESVKTWKHNRPLFHVSNTKVGSSRINEHSDILYEQEKLSDVVAMLPYADFDIEAKHKELAVQSFYKFIKEEQEYAGD